jgi:ribonuclease P protein component
VEQSQRYTFAKNEHLKSRKTIQLLFDEGKSFSIFPFRVIWKYTDDSAAVLQAGFTAGSKHFKKAVDRNRIRRLMREAYRLQKNKLQVQLKEHQKHMAVFFVYTGNEIPDYQTIFDKTGSVLKRLIKIVHENTLADT